MYKEVSLEKGRKPGMRARGTLLIYTCALPFYHVCSSVVICCPWRSVAMMSVLLSVCALACVSVRFVEHSSMKRVDVEYSSIKRVDEAVLTRLWDPLPMGKVWRTRSAWGWPCPLNFPYLESSQGQPQVDPAWVPGIARLCRRGWEISAPGWNFQVASYLQSLGHQDSSRASTPDRTQPNPTQ